MDAKTANRKWIDRLKRRLSAFDLACAWPSRVQLEMLNLYMDVNSATAFGRAYGFQHIETLEQYQSQVPLQTWADIEPWVDRIAKGEQNILTNDPVIAFEETSGTTAFSKLIPYTERLKKEFMIGIETWMASLAVHYPKVFEGKAYWSISPPTRPVWQTEGGIPVGVVDDASYFPPEVQQLLPYILAIPPNLHQAKDADDLYNRTWRYLLESEEAITFLSVWSPSFLLRMIDHLRSNVEQLQQDFGDLFPAGFAETIQLKTLLPQLQLVSCWTDAQAALYLPALQKAMGDIPIQGKGLMATEGITSIPLLPGLPPVLSLYSHFYEFRDVVSQSIYGCWEIEHGKRYEVILTTGGGLYRYATGDMVRVDDFYDKAPCLTFMGRSGNTSDLVGEKLDEAQVIDALQTTLGKLLEQCQTIFLYPVIEAGERACYQLCVEPTTGSRLWDQKILDEVAHQVEQHLCRNRYYQEAVALQQLSPLTAYLLPSGFHTPLRQHLQSKGQAKAATLKLPVLFQVDALKALL